MFAVGRRRPRPDDRARTIGDVGQRVLPDHPEHQRRDAGGPIAHGRAVERPKREQRPVGVVRRDEPATQPRQCLHVRCRTVDVATRLGEPLQLPVLEPATLDSRRGVDGSDVSHEGGQLAGRRLDDP
jgi:hypothetical protein